MNKPLSVTFWGVRGSHPVPGSRTVGFGGNTTCLQVSAGGLTIIIDAGTGIINLGKKLVGEYFESGSENSLDATVFFTHLHHDHTQGLPFFQPLYLGQSVLHLFGPRNFGDELAVVLERSMIPPNFPVDFYHSNSIKEITSIKENNIIVFNPPDPTPHVINRFRDTVDAHKAESQVVVRVHSDYSHPVNGVLVYRIEYGGKSVVFATDIEGYAYGNTKLIQFARNADLLIHDSQYSIEQYVSLPTPRQGYGHSTPEMAIEVARKAGVKTLACTHHDPASSDTILKKNQTKYKRRFKDLFYTREGLTHTVE